MLTALLLAFMFLALPVAEQRGFVSGINVRSGSAATDEPVVLTIRGTNPCGAVQVDFGDGESTTLPIGRVPATITHEFTSPGTYRVRAQGVNNCDGEAVATVNVSGGRTAGTSQADRMRFRGMDRNRDGVISRQEWRGNTQSFNQHDWNRDGVLSQDEVLAGGGEGDFSWWPDSGNDRTDQRFADLDDNLDGVISRSEWRGTRQSFNQTDLNSDGFLSRRELAASQADASQTGRRVVTVAANEPWNDTGILVRMGDTLVFEAQGTVRLSANEPDIADPAGSRTGRLASNAPLREEPAGALLARIGNSGPLLIGAARTMDSAPASGRLYLSVNDDHHSDNSGEYRVHITVLRHETTR